VLPLAALDAWWDALRAVFPHAPSRVSAPAWTMWAESVTYTPLIASASPHYDGIHVMAASALGRSLHAVANDSALGICLGRDVVMRLGDDAVTPDLLLITPERFPQLHATYLDGPADLVIEITMPGHERDETVLRRQRYAAAAVPEYWTVDPTARSVTFLRYVDGTYQEQPLAPDSAYRPAQLPGLACVPARLWDALFHPDHSLSGDCHVVEWTAPSAPATLARPWPLAHLEDRDARPFAPTIGRQPTRITFDQYLAWCPEARFEWIGGQIVIGDWRGTRNVLGLLLMTFGLDAAVHLLPPRT